MRKTHADEYWLGPVADSWALSAVYSDTRLGLQAQTVAMDFQKVFRVTDKTFLGLAGLATDVQSVSQL